MAKRIKKTQIVDAVSGEVLQENRETVYTSEAYIPGQGYRLYSRKHIRLGKDWDQTLKMRQWGWLVQIILSMDENNMADIHRLTHQFQVSPRRVYQLLADLKRFGAIKKVAGGYAVNPSIAFAGTYLSPQLYRLFQPDLERVVPAWAKVLYDRECDNSNDPTV